MKELVPTFALALVALSGCAKKSEPNRENFRAAMVVYLEKRGDLCLGKDSWPIDVSENERVQGARNAVQMPVLERLGLVSSSDATVEIKTEDGTTTATVRRYRLTDEGRKYYLSRDTNTLGAAGDRAGHGDFCVAKLSLNEVVGWELSNGDPPQATVSYTYRVNAPDWTRTPEAERVFPAVVRVIQGERSARLKETFTLGREGFIAVDLLDRSSLVAEQRPQLRKGP